MSGEVFSLGDEWVFEWGDLVERDGAAGDFFWGSVDEAELADGEAAFRRNGQAEEPAGHGACVVEVAEAGFGVKDGTGVVVGEVFKAGVGWVEDAGGGVAWKFRQEAGEGLSSAIHNGGGAGCVRASKFIEAAPEAKRIELRNGKDAVAALGASWLACEPGTGGSRCLSGGGIDDENELVVAGREGVHESEFTATMGRWAIEERDDEG